MIFQDTFNIIVLLLLIFIIYKLSFERFSNLTTQDLESISNLSSMYDKGELKISKLHVTDDVKFDKNLKVKNLHVDDHSSTKRLDIRNNGDDNDTHFNFNNEGKNYFRGKNWIQTTGPMDTSLKNFLDNDSGVKDHHIGFTRINSERTDYYGKIISKHTNIPAIVSRGYNYDYEKKNPNSNISSNVLSQYNNRVGKTYNLSTLFSKIHPDRAVNYTSHSAGLEQES
jgi:hypothetical protein